MCGFIGLVSERPINDNQRSQVIKGLEATQYRGPDVSKTWSDDHIFLGHNRLSILDTSANSNQPIFSNCGRYAMVYNGEIYNYRHLVSEHLGHVPEKIAGDTIALLHLYKKYGPACVNMLNGMFAIVIIDLLEKTIFTARDRFGEKPLYIHQAKDQIFFASEIRALEQVLDNKSLNFNSFIHYSHFGYIPHPGTIYNEIYTLENGTYNMYQYGKGNVTLANTVKYWDIGVGLASSNSLSLKEQIIKSVDSRLVSDVEVGLFLSGGMDSASLLSTLKYLGRDISCISCDFEDEIYSEIDRTRITAKHFGVDLKEFLITHQMLLDENDHYFKAMDQPTVNGFNTFLISKFAKSEGIKVWLSGTGGDEVFGGYPSFRNFESRLNLAKKLSLLKLLKINKIPFTSNMKMARLLYLISSSDNNANNTYSTFRAFLPPNVTLMNADLFPTRYTKSVFDTPTGVERLDSFQLASFYETRYYLGQMLLRDIDNFSMNSSIELRSPFLDHELFEKVWSMKKEDQYMHSQSKRLLTENIPFPLSDSISKGSKRGFAVPSNELLLNSSDVEDVLYAPEIRLWNRKRLSSIYDAFRRKENDGSIIWMVYTANKWLLNKSLSV